VSRVESDGIMLTSSSGISKVYFTELPKDVQERFHYDSAKGAAYSAQEGANQEALRQQTEVAKRKIADEKNRYWIEKELGTQSVTETQTSPTIEVMWATYGTASQDRDVREIVQSLLGQPRPDTRVGTELFGPVSTTNNSLFVVFVYKGLYYQTELRDGELISFASVQPAQATPEEAANAYKLWSDSIAKAVTGNPTRADIALSARLSNTPTWQGMRAKFRETVNRWNEEDKKARRVQANVERIKQLQQDSTRQQQAAANYER